MLRKYLLFVSIKSTLFCFGLEVTDTTGLEVEGQDDVVGSISVVDLREPGTSFLEVTDITGLEVIGLDDVVGTATEIEY